MGLELVDGRSKLDGDVNLHPDGSPPSVITVGSFIVCIDDVLLFGRPSRQPSWLLAPGSGGVVRRGNTVLMIAKLAVCFDVHARHEREQDGLDMGKLVR